MQDLKVVGVEDNALVAVSDEGDRFRVVIDAVMQTKLRQMQSTRSSDQRVSPREIQALIRAGMSREEVAAATGASTEDVERYELPVLAERDFVLTSALAVKVHLPEAAEIDTFGAMIRVRLSDLNARGERWVAWRDQDRGWMVKLEFTANDVDHDARWTFDSRSNSLHPVNADATSMSKGGELKGPLIPRLRAVDTTQPDSSRFDSGAFTFAEDVADSTDVNPIADVATSPIQLSSPQATEAAIHREPEPEHNPADTEDLLDRLRQRRGEATPAPEFDPYAPHDDEASDVTMLEAVPEFAPDEAPEPLQDTQPIATADIPGPRRKGRAQMPSWDEIVFGTKSDEDPA